MIPHFSLPTKSVANVTRNGLNILIKSTIALCGDNVELAHSLVPFKSSDIRKSRFKKNVSQKSRTFLAGVEVKPFLLLNLKNIVLNM